MYDVAPDGQKFLMVKPVEADGGERRDVVLVQNWFEELKRLLDSAD